MFTFRFEEEEYVITDMCKTWKMISKKIWLRTEWGEKEFYEKRQARPTVKGGVRKLPPYPPNPSFNDGSDGKMNMGGWCIGVRGMGILSSLGLQVEPSEACGRRGWGAG